MAENNTIVDSANNLYFESVEGEDGLSINADAQVKSNLAGLIEARFADSKMARDSDENRWITAYHNFRGIYPKNVRFRESEKSRVFIKVTKTKVLAAFGQLIDVIFGTGKFPIGVAHTPLPEGVSEYMHLDTQAAPGIETNAQREAPEEMIEGGVGFAGDGRVLKPGARMNSGQGIFEDLENNDQVTFVEGPTPIPNIPEISPAKEAARNMEKLIHDQIDESGGSTELRNAIFESTLFGTGIVKGPFNFNKTIHRWEDSENGREYTPTSVRVPRIEFVSIWDFFPDPNATAIEECEYVVHRHKLNRSQLRALRKMPYFNEDAIRDCMMLGPNYTEEDYEYELKDDQRMSEMGASRFEVLEYWGLMDAEYAKEVGIELPEGVDILDEVQINAWICNGLVLRAVINPFTPHRIPYNAFPYERNTL